MPERFEHEGKLPAKPVLIRVLVLLKDSPSEVTMNNFMHDIYPLFWSEEEGWKTFPVDRDGDYMTIQKYEDYTVRIVFQVENGEVKIKEATLTNKNLKQIALDGEAISCLFKTKTVEREQKVTCKIFVNLLWRQNQKTWLARIEKGKYFFLEHIDFTPICKIGEWTYEGYREYVLYEEGEYVARQAFGTQGSLRVRFKVEKGQVVIIDAGGIEPENAKKQLRLEYCRS